MTRPTVVLLLAVLASAACDDPATPGSMAATGVNFTYLGGPSYAADGVPDFEGGDVGAGTFAIAFPDSVGGLVLSSFQKGDGTRGDLFILQLTVERTGDFGPCGVRRDSHGEVVALAERVGGTGSRSWIGGDCHGRLLENIDAENLQSLDAAWEIASGIVQVTEAGPERVVGSFKGLTLAGDDGFRTIDSGTFDLPLLSAQQGVDIMQCFLTRLTGGSCDG